MLNKKELRNKARGIRKSLDMIAISYKIVENIRNLDEYKNANNIMIFYPLEHEVNLLQLMNDRKNIYLPKVDGENLLVCPYNEGDELSVSSFRTKEPVSNSVSAEILDLVFVPALMVDKHLHRLGYGGGFYDRFLSNHASHALKIVAIPDVLKVDELPSESFDARIDIVVTETNQAFA